MNRVKRGTYKRADVSPEILLRVFRHGKRMVGANYIVRWLKYLALSVITSPVSSLWNWIATHRQRAASSSFSSLSR